MKLPHFEHCYVMEGTTLPNELEMAPLNRCGLIPEAIHNVHMYMSIRIHALAIGVFGG